MKPSEAILKGCVGTVKIQGRLYDGDNGCCVMGAMLAGISPGGLDDVKRGEQPFAPAEIYYAYRGNKSYWDECVRKNNMTNQSRESIARWLQKKGL